MFTSPLRRDHRWRDCRAWGLRRSRRRAPACERHGHHGRFGADRADDPGPLARGRRGSIHIGKHAVLGANVVVHPNVTIGEGTIVGSQSLVTKSLPPWTICLGVPARVVRPRERETITAYERALLEFEASAS